MSKYTTRELAKLCSVTVRTVQYYDTRGILIPSELSEGGRRLYSDDDLRRMKIICFLRQYKKKATGIMIIRIIVMISDGMLLFPMTILSNSVIFRHLPRPPHRSLCDHT